MREIKVKWTGIRPLIMHNGRMVDPTNPNAQEIKEITSKGSKKLTSADYERRDWLEWEGSLYWDDETGPVIPSDNVEATIRAGAQKRRIGKDVQAGVLVQEDDIPVHFDGPKTKEGMFADSRFSLKKGVVVQRQRIIRVRPMIPNPWSITFTVEYDEGVIKSKDALLQAMTDAGALCGLGDWRPKYGRFIPEVLNGK